MDLPGTITNALTFDIEDWFHMVEIDAVADPASWPSLPSLVVDYTRRIVDTLAEAKVRATFFVLGWVAHRHPEIVKSIAAAGHELASHSFWHSRIDQLTPQQLHDDVKQSIDAIEQQAGKKVLGFRAPSFSITLGAEWIFDVLLDLGLVYDASLFPGWRGHGGYPCREGIHHFDKVLSGRQMLELPMSMLKLGPLNVPFSGGGYLRALPAPLIRYAFRQLNGRGLPVVVYLHPRDFAPECPRVPMSPYRHFKCYVGLRSTANKLRMLLHNYRFDTCAAILGLDERTGEIAAPQPIAASAPVLTLLPLRKRISSPQAFAQAR